MSSTGRDLGQIAKEYVDRGLTLDDAVKRMRQRMAIEALVVEQGHCQRAALRLGIHRNILTRILKDAKLDGFAARRMICEGQPLAGRPPKRMEQAVQQ